MVENPVRGAATLHLLHHGEQICHSNILLETLLCEKSLANFICCYGGHWLVSGHSRDFFVPL